MSRARVGRNWPGERILLPVALLVVIAGCSCSDFAEVFSIDARIVASVDGGLVGGDGGTVGYCDGPWVEVADIPEALPPWGGGPLSEFGLIRRLFDADAGVIAQEVILTFGDGGWSAHDTKTQMQIDVLGNNGEFCGRLYDDAGYSHLRLEFPDGGALNPPSAGACLGFKNGWWTTWDNGHVLRGKDSRVESVGNWDAGIIPGVIPPGVAPNVQAISETGEVAIYVSYRAPGGYLLPSGVRLEDPPGLGIAGPMGFVSSMTYGANAGVPSIPLMWTSAGNIRQMDIGDESAHFFQIGQFRVHSDGHFCAGIERTNGLSDTIAFWRQDGGFVSPAVFEAGDAGMRVLSDLHPGDCWPVGRDWYFVVYFHEPEHRIDSTLVRVKLDCIP